MPWIVAHIAQPLTQADLDRFFESLRVSELIASAFSDYWWSLAVAVWMLASSWMHRGHARLARAWQIPVLVWAFEAEYTLLLCLDGNIWPFDLLRELVTAGFALALLGLMLLLLGGRAEGRRGLWLLVPVTFATVILDWGFVLLVVTPLPSVDGL